MIALEELAVPIKLMVSLGMDGPNVNISIMEKLNRIKREKVFQQLVTCPPSFLIHICHNSFCRGWEKYGLNAEELCLNLYYFFFFTRSACKRQDLFQIEESLGLEELAVLHHELMDVSSASLTMSCNCKRCSQKAPAVGGIKE